MLAHATVLVPQGQDVIRGAGEFSGPAVTVTQDAIYVRELAGGPSRLAAFTHDGKGLPDVPAPPVAAVSEVTAMPDHGLLYEIATYLRPPYYQRFDPGDASGDGDQAGAKPVRSVSTMRLVTREFAVSQGWTRIPVNNRGLAGPAQGRRQCDADLMAMAATASARNHSSSARMRVSGWMAKACSRM